MDGSQSSLSSSQQQVIKQKTLWSAICLGIIGSSIFTLAPIFLATASEKFHLGNQQTGLLASSELAGIAFTSMTSSLWLSRFTKQYWAWFGLLLFIVSNLLTLLCTTVDQLLYVRFLSGLTSSGVLYVLAVVVIGNTENATRNFGLFVFVQMIFSAIMLNLLPVVFSSFSFTHVLLFLAILGASGLLTTRNIPSQNEETVFVHNHKRLRNTSGLLELTGLFFTIMSLSVIWTYSASTGNAIGLDIHKIEMLLGASMIPQAIGALLPMLTGHRIGTILPLLVALTGQLTGLLILTGSNSYNEYFCGISLWGACFNLGLVCQLGMISIHHEKKQLLGLVPAVQALAVASGPVFGALFLTEDGSMIPVFIIAAIAASISHLLFVFLALRSNNKAKAIRQFS